MSTDGSIYRVEVLTVAPPRCPRDHALVYLRPNTDSRLPSFYICHECGYIAEHAVGVICAGKDK